MPITCSQRHLRWVIFFLSIPNFSHLNWWINGLMSASVTAQPNSYWDVNEPLQLVQDHMGASLFHMWRAFYAMICIWSSATIEALSIKTIQWSGSIEMQIRAEGRLLRHAAAEQENPSCSHFGVPFWAIWTMTASVLDVFFIINMSHLCLRPHFDATCWTTCKDFIYRF